jgi:hypothetical protein
MAESYQTLDNGFNPFTVKIEDNKVSVYTNNYNEEVDERELEFFQEYNPSHIFIGKSIVCPMTIFSGARDDPKFDGNSILLELNPKTFEYVYIGESIYSFKAYSKILSYVSPVGNSEVSYPYAIDEFGNHYLMIEDVVLEMTERFREKLHDGQDAYEYYYSSRHTFANNFEDIKMLKIDDENYNFTYSVEGFAKFVARFKNAQVSMVKYDNSEEYFTKESYTELMKRFADYRKFQPFMDKQIIHKRIW